ncbi:MAG: hypothetical protein EOP92_42330, partial [Lysobacteraceae bacterium]
MLSTPTLSRLSMLLVALVLMPSARASTHAFAATEAAAVARDDLYRAANGTWLNATNIPADKAEVYGADLPGTIRVRLRRILDSLRAQPEAASGNGRKLLDFHDSLVDIQAIDRAGLAPITPLLAGIDAIDTPEALARWQGQVQGILKTPLWLWGGFADFKDPSVNRVIVMQGGLGLPDRDYYLLDEPRLAKARLAYSGYLETLARL